MVIWKNKILYIFSVLLLIFVIIGFVNLIFYAYEIDMDDINDFIKDKKEFEVTVINMNNVTMDVRCYLHYENDVEDDLHIDENYILSNTSYTFRFEYFDENKPISIDIKPCYDDPTSIKYIPYAKDTYYFSDEIYDLLAVINPYNNIVITKK